MKDAGDLDIAVTENGFDKLSSKFILDSILDKSLFILGTYTFTK